MFLRFSYNGSLISSRIIVGMWVEMVHFHPLIMHKNHTSELCSFTA